MSEIREAYLEAQRQREAKAAEERARMNAIIQKIHSASEKEGDE